MFALTESISVLLAADNPLSPFKAQVVVVNSSVALACRFELPTGAESFAPVRMQVPAMNGLLARAADRVLGDAGFVYFDLERARARLLPVPEGFTTVSLLTCFTPALSGVAACLTGWPAPGSALR